MKIHFIRYLGTKVRVRHCRSNKFVNSIKPVTNFPNVLNLAGTHHNTIDRTIHGALQQKMVRNYISPLVAPMAKKKFVTESAGY